MVRMHLIRLNGRSGVLFPAEGRHQMADTTPIRGIYEKEPGSGIWWVRWTDATGMLHREKAGRRSDAKTLVGKRRTETLQKKKLPEQFRTKITFNSLCDDANEHSRATNDPKVSQDLKLKIERMRPVFGSKDATTITKQQIVRWLTDEAEDREWAGATRNRWQAAFSLIYRVGIDNKKVEENPASGIKRKTENKVDRYLSNEEEAALRKVILQRFPTFIHQLDLSLHTGMRRKEQYTLRWNQVNMERQMLTLPKTKNGEVRYIDLNSVAMDAFRALKVARTDGNALVFPSGRIEGEALQGARGWFDSALEGAQIGNYTWHCNRHSFASRLVMAGVNLYVVGKLLGHKSLTMTQRYAHLAPEQTASAVKMLESVS